MTNPLNQRYKPRLVIEDLVPYVGLSQYDLMMIHATEKAQIYYAEYLIKSHEINNRIGDMVQHYSGSHLEQSEFEYIRRTTIDLAKQKIESLVKVSQFVGTNDLGYYLTDKDGNSYFKSFSKDEIDEILKGNFPNIQMHHEASIKLLYDNTSSNMLRKVISVDNINPYTQKAHLLQHSGNWQNPSNNLNPKIENAERETRIDLKNGDAHDPNFDAIDNSLIVMLGFYSISMLLRQFYAYKRGEVINKSTLIQDTKTIGLDSFISGGIYFTTVSTRSIIDSIDTLNHFDALSSMDELVGSASAFTVAATIRTAYVGWRSGYCGSVIFSDSCEALHRSAIRSGVFIIGGILLDCFTPLPDPTITLIVTGARLTWNIGAFIYNHSENKEANKKICEIRRNKYNQEALASLAVY